MTLFDVAELPDDRHWYTMRAPCPTCSCEKGYILERNGQNVVRCGDCNRACYNAPKTETGQKVRSISSRPDIKPSRRARLLERDSHQCIGCGQRPPTVSLHIGHLLSVSEGRKMSVGDDVLFSDENLAAMCDECNLGFGMSSVSAQLLYRVIKIRSTNAGRATDA